MINIEYNKNELAGVKRPNTQWVETDNKNLQLMELVLEKSEDNTKIKMMQVEK
jgi:hypothetical protein